jgi:hypothetical protein
MTDDAYQEPPDPVLDFLSARHAEDEAAAKAAGGFLDSGGPAELAADMRSFQWRGATLAEAAIAHIARNAPARALRRVEAGRALVAAYERSVRAVGVGLSQDLRRPLLAHAAIWSDFPGYDPAWT